MCGLSSREHISFGPLTTAGLFTEARRLSLGARAGWKQQQPWPQSEAAEPGTPPGPARLQAVMAGQIHKDPSRVSAPVGHSAGDRRAVLPSQASLMATSEAKGTEQHFKDGLKKKTLESVKQPPVLCHMVFLFQNGGTGS